MDVNPPWRSLGNLPAKGKLLVGDLFSHSSARGMLVTSHGPQLPTANRRRHCTSRDLMAKTSFAEDNLLCVGENMEGEVIQETTNCSYYLYPLSEDRVIELLLQKSWVADAIATRALPPLQLSRSTSLTALSLASLGSSSQSLRRSLRSERSVGIDFAVRRGMVCVASGCFSTRLHYRN